MDKKGEVVATAETQSMWLDPGTSIMLSAETTVEHPLFWSLEEPNLYQLLSTVQDANSRATADECATTFGIRTIKFDPDEGFFLNGKAVKIKGTCNHQDHAGVGSALPDRIQYYRIEKLKEMGMNAYRTSHNPPTPELLDACDRLGHAGDGRDADNVVGPGGHERSGTHDPPRPQPSERDYLVARNEEPMQGTERGARIVSSA